MKPAVPPEPLTLVAPPMMKRSSPHAIWSLEAEPAEVSRVWPRAPVRQSWRCS